ncbi:hypothetical protein L208DRAFT_364525 [Tricholoma matsutake]|nr:hypothetical protein L208DRAFT_364525 [Tricholoma matsutake 945]
MFFFFHSALMSSLASHWSCSEFLFFCLLSRHHTPSLKTGDGGGCFLLFSTNESFPSLASVVVGILFFLSLFFLILCFLL